MDVKAQFTYLQWQDLYEKEKPFQIFVSFNFATEKEQVRENNLAFHQGAEETIHDCRGREESFELDKQGFTFVKHASGMTNWEDAAEVKTKYLPEVEQLLRQHVEGVDEVFFFDWRFRRSNTYTPPGKEINLNDRLHALAPAFHVHIDQSPTAVVKRVRAQCSEEKLSGRVRVINIWRPLRGPIEQWPLAICDARTVKQSDLVACDHVRAHYTGETYYVKQSSDFSWYYLSKQYPDEVLLFKNFDSADVDARSCPHASFQLPGVDQSTAPRESIEVRALVFSHA